MGRHRAGTVVGNRPLSRFQEEALMAKTRDGGDPGSGQGVLAELQKAVAEHERILQRQEELIRRLREELKDVDR
jgi:hypothetical protein